MLHLYAADLARSPDGRWWVIDDRTQAPSGAGYALENRLVISRVFPELFRDLKVQRLARFFATLRDSLAHWAPHGRDRGTAPFTVLLTPGPHNETYFEQAYLARYLGFPLVEGSDLTVREGCVWLKTLSGLKRVHAILRRLDDDYCDPLELRSDSALGVPGLVDAVRRGNVLVANALGSSLLESGTLLGYLPALAEKLLGEPLKMPSVATWWCGEPAALEEVEANSTAWSSSRRSRSCASSRCSARTSTSAAASACSPCCARARTTTWRRSWCTCRRRRSGTAGTHAACCARSIGLRVFACASPNGYMVMPGGLTRVASAGGRARDLDAARRLEQGHLGARGRAGEHLQPAAQIGRPEELVRAGTNLSSRVVENLYWFGRYCERCDGVARLLRVALGRFADDAPGATTTSAPGR